MIKEFYINGLFDERNVRIPFNHGCKIIVANNGFGKTTVLNLFYALIAGDVAKLKKVKYESIGVVFENKVKVEINKSEFENDYEYKIGPHPLFAKLDSEFGREYVRRLKREMSTLPLKMYKKSSYIKRAVEYLGVPPHFLYEVNNHFDSDSAYSINIKLLEKFNIIRENFKFKSLYFPTYRRIEEDILSFTSEEDSLLLERASINFGMRDVKASIKKITSEILSSSVERFSKINGQMLSQLVRGFSVSKEMIDSVSKPKAVEIVLERIGNDISPEHKSEILSLVNTGEILKNHDPLLYFVSNLLKVYEQQQVNDAAIQKFTKLCNKYLIDKEVVYNESVVTVEIIRKKNKTKVDIDVLSSGEKQIISLFSALCFSEGDNLAIFFDEPELSLSIEWQKTLLPDILDSGNCKFLFCTTHSPFIFDNDLEKFTVDLIEYIEEL